MTKDIVPPPARPLQAQMKPATLLPIASAPKDGRFIVVFGPSGYTSIDLRAEVCKYSPACEDPWRNHANDGFEDGGPAPLYWLPYPNTPQT